MKITRTIFGSICLIGIIAMEMHFQYLMYTEDCKKVNLASQGLGMIVIFVFMLTVGYNQALSTENDNLKKEIKRYEEKEDSK